MSCSTSLPPTSVDARISGDSPLEKFMLVPGPTAGGAFVALHHFVGHGGQAGHAQKPIRLFGLERAGLPPARQSRGRQPDDLGQRKTSDSHGAGHLIQRRERQATPNDSYRSFTHEEWIQRRPAWRLGVH